MSYICSGISGTMSRIKFRVSSILILCSFCEITGTSALLFKLLTRRDFLGVPAVQSSVRISRKIILRTYTSFTNYVLCENMEPVLILHFQHQYGVARCVNNCSISIYI